jgi:arabinofuranosyltransferase
VWRKLAFPAALFAALAVLMLAHAHYYGGFLADDALISLRYARRFVEGHGLSWTGNERVEGYTDFLWVLLAAAGGRLGFDYIGTALFLDRAGVLVALAVVGISPRTGQWSAARLLGGGLLLATTGPVAVWANGGLEQGFMTGVLALAILLLERAAVTGGDPRRAWRGGLPLAALTLLRADGIVLVAFALLGALVAEVAKDAGGRRRAVERLAMTAVPAAVVLAGQHIFRRIYYGQWQPNTAMAKLAFNRQRLGLGIGYVRHGYTASAVLVAVAVVATFGLARRRSLAFTLVPAAVVLGWTAYVATVGGDIFPGWRQLLFGLVPLALLAAELAERVPPRWMAVLALASCGLAWTHLGRQMRDPENQRAVAERWEWDGMAIGALLKQAFASRQPLFAVDAAGCLAYASELPSLDMLGLNDAYLAHHPPPAFGHGNIGHELGDGAYVLGRAPDLVAFRVADNHDPAFPSGLQMVKLPAFRRSYQWIRVRAFAGRPVLGEIWVRREEGRVGVIRRPGRIEVPGYLFTGARSAAVSRLDERGALVTDLASGSPGIFPALEVPAGRWRVEISPPAAALSLGLRCGSRSAQPLGAAAPAAPVVIELDRPARVDLVVAPGLSEPSAPPLARVVLTQAAGAGPTVRCAEPGRPLTVTPDQLAPPRPAGLFWGHPANLVLGLEGLVVKMDRRRPLRRVELSVDHNDVYAVVLARGGRALWRREISPLPTGDGLAVRVLDLPPGTLVQPNDELTVIPSGGDGFYSVGHLGLYP